MENDEGSTATTGLPNQSDDNDEVDKTPEVVKEADLRNQHIMDAIDRVARAGPASSSSVHSEDDAMEEGAEDFLTEDEEVPEEDGVPEANVINTRSPSSSFSHREFLIYSPTNEGTRIPDDTSFLSP